MHFCHITLMLYQTILATVRENICLISQIMFHRRKKFIFTGLEGHDVDFLNIFIRYYL